MELYPKGFRPTEAVSKTIIPSDLVWPRTYFVSAKLDGLRLLGVKKAVVSKKLELIPNKYVQSILSHPDFYGTDGEGIVGAPTALDCYRVTESAFMSEDGEPDFTFHIFDLWNLADRTLRQRYAAYRRRVERLAAKGWPVLPVEQKIVTTPEECEHLANGFIGAGYEGAMVRWVDAPYKMGRCTLLESYMAKIKPFDDSEFIVTEIIEATTNTNEAEIDNRGLAKRSKAKAGLVPSGTLGKFKGYDFHTKQNITVSPGFMKAPERLRVFQNQEEYIGRIGKYRFSTYGIKDKPRHPRWIGWRDLKDITSK